MTLPHTTRRIFLIRHAATEWNQAQKIQGHTDVPLSEQGRTHTQLFRHHLEKHLPFLFDPQQTAVVSSDLSRAHETAQIAFSLPNRVIHLEPMFRECSYGVLEGISRQDLETKHPTQFIKWQNGEWDACLGGGETRRALLNRTLQGLEKWLAALPHPCLAIISHGGVMRQMHDYVCSEDKKTRIRNLDILPLSFEQGRWLYQPPIF